MIFVEKLKNSNSICFTIKGKRRKKIRENRSEFENYNYNWAYIYAHSLFICALRAERERGGGREKKLGENCKKDIASVTYLNASSLTILKLKY